MEMPTTPPRELPIIGGHLALDLANTVDDPRGPERWDHIATVDGLAHWAERVGLATPESSQRLCASDARTNADSGLSGVQLLRDVLNDVFGALAEGEPVTAEAWGRLRPFVAEAVSAAALVPEDHHRNAYRYDWSHLTDVHSVIDPVAASAGQLLISDDLSRLKRCARCPWLFLDHSKNQSRRWCDMNDCGRADKIERYLAKRATRRETTGPERSS